MYVPQQGHTIPPNSTSGRGPSVQTCEHFSNCYTFIISWNEQNGHGSSPLNLYLHFYFLKWFCLLLFQVAFRTIASRTQVRVIPERTARKLCLATNQGTEVLTGSGWVFWPINSPVRKWRFPPMGTECQTHSFLLPFNLYCPAENRTKKNGQRADNVANWKENHRRKKTSRRGFCLTLGPLAKLTRYKVRIDLQKLQVFRCEHGSLSLS